jgi:hypothetical protein
MSGITAAGVLAAAAVAGTAYTVYNGQQQASAQKKAMNQAKSTADKQATLADQAMNKENQKRPNTTEILDAANQAGRGGVTGTMLTGSTGVDKNTLALGRNALLGG